MRSPLSLDRNHGCRKLQIYEIQEEGEYSGNGRWRKGTSKRHQHFPTLSTGPKKPQHFPFRMVLNKKTFEFYHKVFMRNPNVNLNLEAPGNHSQGTTFYLFCFVFLIPVPICQFLLGNSFGHFFVPKSKKVRRKKFAFLD